MLPTIAALAIGLYPLIYLGMYLGDAEIHLVYGAHAAEGRYFEFNPGDKSSGVTSVGYMLLLAQLFSALPSQYVPLAIKVLNIATWYAVAACTCLIGRRLVAHPWALAAAMVVGMMPGSVVNATGGMENGLFALAVTVSFYLMMRFRWLVPHERPSRAGDVLVAVMLALCCALRPEGIPFTALAVASRVYLHWTATRQAGGALATMLIPGAATGAVTLALALFHHAQTGDWLPGSALSRATMSAAGAVFLGPFWFDPKFAIRLAAYAPVTLLFLAGSVLVLTGRWRSAHRVEGLLILVFWVFFVLYSTVLGSVHLARYVIFLMPPMVLVAAIGGERWWTDWDRTRWTSILPSRRVVAAGLALGLGAVFTVETILRLPLGGRDELWRVMRAPQERKAYSDALIAALGRPPELPVSLAYQEVQARYWLDDRFVVRSLDGRTDNVLLKYVRDGHFDHIGYLRERQVDYLAEIVNYNRDRTGWSLNDLSTLREGASVRQGDMNFTRLPNGMFAIDDVQAPAVPRAATGR